MILALLAAWLLLGLDAVALLWHIFLTVALWTGALAGIRTSWLADLLGEWLCRLGIHRLRNRMFADVPLFGRPGEVGDYAAYVCTRRVCSHVQRAARIQYVAKRVAS